MTTPPDPVGHGSTTPRPSGTTAAESSPISEGQSALCLSGGGIRSATFGLGVVQALARLGWLSQFDYLSTVSGGGYTGGWLSAWIHNVEKTLNLSKAIPGSRRQAVRDVEVELQHSTRDGQPEPEQVRRLRAYSSYLSPKSGLSNELLALMAIYFRNLFLNWLVLFPLLLVVVLIPPVVILAGLTIAAMISLSWGTPGLIELNGSAGLCLCVAAASAVTAIAYTTSDLPNGIFHQTTRSYFRWFWALPMTFGCFALAQVVISPSWTIPSGDLKWLLCMAAAASIPVQLIGIFLGAYVRGYRAIDPDKSSPVTHAAWFATARGRIAHARKELGVRGFCSAIVSGAFGGVLLALLLRGSEAFQASTRFGLSPAGRIIVLETLVVPLLMLVFQLATVLYLAFWARTADEGPREWWGLSAGITMRISALWVSAGALCVLLPLDDLSMYLPPLRIAGILGALTAAVVGYFGASGSGATPASTGVRRATAVVLDRAAEIGALVFAIALIGGLSWWSNRIINHYGPGEWSLRSNATPGAGTLLLAHLIAFICALLLAISLSFVIQRNRYSLSSLYGNRLVRAFLGSGRPASDRHVHAFTQFDPADDVAFSRLSTEGPLKHIVNAALNLSVAGTDELAVQQRKATHFVFQSDFCGRPKLPGGSPAQLCPSRRYAAKDGITLGRAVSISGAAASPNMGYHTSALVALVLCIFNIRLGAWLPNPKYASENKRRTDRMEQEEPQSPLTLALSELIGRTTSSSEFIYVSDGGHFENLGLYEVVRLGCTRVFVVDASCDPNYEYGDLERALRIIRADLGVSIEVHGLPALKEDGRATVHWVTGDIDYGVQKDGKHKRGQLIYVKPGVTGDEPVDVLAFAIQCRKLGIPFPHHSTTDQFFEETEFESYRALGFHTIGCDLAAAPPFTKFMLPARPKGIQRPAAKSLEPLLMASTSQARAARTSAFSFLKTLAWMLIVLFIGAPIVYTVVQQAPQNTLLLLPNQRNLVLRADDTLTAFFDGHDRIALPLFERASGCGGGPVSGCKHGIGREIGITAQEPRWRALQNLRVALQECERSGVPGAIVEVRGYSDSSDFIDESRQRMKSDERNAQLADIRACRVANLLNGGGPIRFVARSWASKAIQSDCATVDKRSYEPKDLAQLDAARILDTAPGTAQNVRSVPPDSIFSMLNRRVELIPTFELAGDCSIESLERTLGKGYAAQSLKYSIPGR